MKNEILFILVIGILLISVFSFVAKGAATGTATGYLILMDQKVSTEDYDALKEKNFESLIYLPSSNCQGYTTSCKFVYPSGTNPKADINSDGKIDAIDAEIMKKAFGCNSAQACWEEPVEECFFVISGRKFRDPTRDCVMNESDANLISSNYGKKNEYALSPSCDAYPECKADVNQDGAVNLFDAVIVGSKFNSKADSFERLLNKKSEADINDDGYIDLRDAITIGVNYGKTAQQTCESTSIDHINANQWRIRATGRGLYYIGVSYLCIL